MACKSNAFVISVVAMLLLVSSIAGWSAPVRDGDPLTIGAVLTQEDGSTATVTAEQIVKPGRSGKSFIIKEWFDKQTTPPRLVVISKQPLPVESGWTCDVTGVLSTVSGVSKDGKTIRQRVLITSPERVSIYMSPNGQRPIPFLPIKGFETDWASKTSLADLAGTSMTASMSAMDGGELPPIPDDLESEPAPPAAGSRDSLKWLPDGASVSLNGAVVSASFSDYGFFYVEKSDRSFGIWISAPDYVYEGQLLDITGRMGTGGGERAVIADQGGVTVLDYYNTYPRPTELGMPNKTLGGGAVGPYTPAIADAAGLNNTGTLVKVWGKVTAVHSQYPIFWIDDGSAVAADDGKTGVKVYDVTYDPLPSVNDFVTLSGVSAAEWPEGSGSNIRVVWKTAPVARSTQPGSGTISGTITATGANGRTVKVYSASSSTTAVFTGNTANYTLNVTYGDHAVTASMLGYKTTTQFATINSGTPVDLDFTLSTLQRRIDVVASPERIPPDGVSQMTVTVIVRDEEGRRFGNEAVTWNVDLGTVISSDVTTDAVGEARLVLQAPSTPGTANVSVTVGGTEATEYAEFASPTAPTVRILTPTLNETVSGVVTIQLHASDPGGYKPGIHQIAVTVDGQPLSAVATGNPNVAWATYTLPNGTHTIRAAASDGDQEYGYSSAVTVTTSNGIYNVAVDNGMFDANDPDPAKRVVTISANQDESTDWEIEIKKRGASSPTKVFTGTGTTISATWNGTDSQGNPAPRGQYGYTIRAGESQGLLAQSYGFSLWDYIVFLRTNPDAPTALLVEGNYFGNNHELFDIVEDACETRGFQVITIPEKYATWDRFQFFMNVYEPTILYMTTHGHYEIRTGTDCLPALLPQVSQFKLKDSWVYAYRPQDNQGNWYPEYPEPGQPAYACIPADPGNQWPGMEAHYVSELGLTYYSPLRLVWMDSCMNGRIGSLYGNLSNQFNPYEVDMYGANDLASMFGIYDNSWTIGASFCGYFEISFADDRYRDFLGRIFGSMKVGYSLDQAITRDAWNERPRHTALYPEGIDQQYGPSNYTDPDEVENWCFNWRVPMPPYHNLRVHGNPWSTYLSP